MQNILEVNFVFPITQSQNNWAIDCEVVTKFFIFQYTSIHKLDKVLNILSPVKSKLNNCLQNAIIRGPIPWKADKHETRFLFSVSIYYLLKKKNVQRGEKLSLIFKFIFIYQEFILFSNLRVQILIIYCLIFYICN